MFRQPVFVWAWLVPLWLISGIAKLIILFVPFRRLAPRLGEAANSTGISFPLSAIAQQKASYIARAIRIVARLTPWHSNCFVQALLARYLLGLYGVPYTIYFGLYQPANMGKLQAHAWVTAGRVFVSGGNGFSLYNVVGVFTSKRITQP